MFSGDSNFGDEPNPYSDASNPYASPGMPGASPQPGFGGPGALAVASQKVKLPAIILLILAPIGMCFVAVDFGFRMKTINSGDFVLGEDMDPVARKGAIFGNYAGAVVDVIAFCCQAFIGYAAWNMKNLKKHTMSAIACGISCVPCLSACCLLGMPFGIWGLVVLNDPVVKSAFDS